MHAKNGACGEHMRRVHAEATREVARTCECNMVGCERSKMDA